MWKRILITMLLGGCLYPAYSQKTNKKADAFSFAIVADPQVSGPDITNSVAISAAKTLLQASKEIESAKPDFTIFLGDLVNTFEPNSVQTFREGVKPLTMPIYLVHGNHDTRYPYTGFTDLQKEFNAIDKVYYSFDHKKWHFVVLPCDFRLSDDLFAWLDDDLKRNAHKPTVVFEHFHLIPLGLSQLEFYGFEMDIRKRLMESLCRHGNVKYYFNGHVHNGIQASVKMSKNVRGINFITVPTIVHTRPFGEEYPEFASGAVEGGYYMMAHADTDSLVLEGRLAGSDQSHIYKQPLPAMDLNDEPLWLHRLAELDGDREWGDTDFGDVSKKWRTKYRYQSDDSPAFIYSDTTMPNGDRALKIRTRSTEPMSWAEDEYCEAYRIVSATPGAKIRLQAQYDMAECTNGGGFVRLTAWDKNGTPYLFVFRWGENEKNASFIPRCWGYELEGKLMGWNYLRDKAKKNEAFFVQLPRSSNSLNVDLEEIYDTATNNPGGFAELGVSKVYVGLGTWVNREPGSVSETIFRHVWLGQDEKLIELPKTTIDYSKVSLTEFGLALDERVKARATKTVKPTGR